MAQRICSVDECNTAHFGKGFCQKHYQRWRKHGDPLVGAAVRLAAVCEAPGCTTAPRSRNLCPKHLGRMQKYGKHEPDFPPPAPRAKVVGVDPCSIAGCALPMRARGWCATHYSRWRRKGDPLHRLRAEVVDGRKVCPGCGRDQPVGEYHSKAARCRQCVNDEQRVRVRERYVPKPRTQAVCEHCGAAFMANKKRRIFCSAACSSTGRHKRNIKHVQTRRARQRGATVEPFLPAVVYERDGWTCQLCDAPIDRSTVKPHPLSPSIDHIVPLVLGGEHSLRNVQAAHLGCNVRKGARMG